MKDGGRLQAAIEILEEIETRHRPVQAALKDWGNSHRFAGSGDRTAIGNLVFDALRHKASLSGRLKSDTARMLVFGTYVLSWEKGAEQLLAVVGDDRHAPETPSEAELSALTEAQGVEIDGAAAADVPDWLWPHFEDAFGDRAVAEGQALAARAPIDLRVNTLKYDRERLLKRLAHVNAVPCPWSPAGLRIYPTPGALRMPHVQAEEAYQKGWFELQDEASQMAALLAGAKPGDQVLDFCAGGGGKTLALAAAMENKGQIYAFDADRLRLAPIHERLKRAGARNIQVRDPASSSLDDLIGEMDLVFIDAPCTGTGVWRRRPDSKWRLSDKALEDRIVDQRNVLDRAAQYVKPGGRLVYATCSVLPLENTGQVSWFLEKYQDFLSVSAAARWQECAGGGSAAVELPAYATARGDITLSPASTNTDGFFVSILEKSQ
ncbi:16S rRNA (cytosine967-C5)-methyltransferase [Roseibium hamelinense]|uniref:16S rRNA (Cytosine967-C5)-methyltransferase n=1 Tax=Roseibium hamelinense TaxID=150831 RepID=A0A562TJ89_9HYPH|nr:RsmB/NOP family class I SAM-dependent RNA methyltransferase [Roseibium hamelinense]MTI45771.1 RsmB/NOP family class I SAM-dependent RNA methyltransferase [Roseibium hamelinense]TWI93046.1 16S rRNA (cytosine967-C5)-methyltransferase [Roseibium hamelinense]